MPTSRGALCPPREVTRRLLDKAPAALDLALQACGLQRVRVCRRLAKIVWASSTPLNATDSRAGKVAALNAAARRAAESVGDVAENDLYALANPLDRKAYWVDTHHYTSAGYELLASQVVEKITAPMATSRDGGTD